MSEQHDHSGQIELAPGVRVAAAEVRVGYSQSSGPGGQNVNKRATRATVRVAIEALKLRPRVEQRLRRLGSRWIVGEEDGAGGEIMISSEEHRTQERNRKEALARLRHLLVEARNVPRPRKKTRPSRGAVERRIKAKKERGEIKRLRKPPRGG